MKKRKIIISVVIVIIALLVAGGIGFYFYEMEKSEEARKLNEKWAEDYKYPWRNAEFHSKDDYFRLNMTISNSDLSDEEKLIESNRLWSRYCEWEQSYKSK